MTPSPITVQLKNGMTAIIRSAELSDADALIENRIATVGQTDFLAAYPEEISLTHDDEENWILSFLEDKNTFLLVAEVGGKIAGTAYVVHAAQGIKYRHRAGFGISILKSFWGNGLGSALVSRAVKLAKDTEFERLELGVFADNERAIRLYEKSGFKKYGEVPKAFKLKDGSYRNEILMARSVS